jgi:hypothetical protein
MPNWCNNNIRITGPNKVIDKIEKIVSSKTDDDNGLLNYFHPMPKELNDTTSPAPNKTAKEKKIVKSRKLKFGADSWYDWRVDNWSTKWDIGEIYGEAERTHIGDDESELSFGFDSAWAPPTGAYEYWISENSNCSIRATYYEGGCDFMGIWDNGEDICYTVSEIAPKGSTDNFWTSAEGKELDDLYGITENMAQYEADQEADRIGDNKKIIKYSKGEKVNV